MDSIAHRYCQRRGCESQTKASLGDKRVPKLQVHARRVHTGTEQNNDIKSWSQRLLKGG